MAAEMMMLIMPMATSMEIKMIGGPLCWMFKILALRLRKLRL